MAEDAVAQLALARFLHYPPARWPRGQGRKSPSPRSAPASGHPLPSGAKRWRAFRQHLPRLDRSSRWQAHARAGQLGIAIARTADGWRLALAHPRTGRLGPVDSSITVSDMSAPRLPVAEAAARLETAGQPFLFFVNAGTGRGNLIYHRYDDHYGLIAPTG